MWRTALKSDLPEDRHGRIAASIRDMDHIDACLNLQEFTGQLMGGVRPELPNDSFAGFALA